MVCERGAAKTRNLPEIDDATTVRLLDAAIAEIAEHGPDRATVTAIARRAGVTTGALYPRWLDKRTLIAAAYDHAAGRVGVEISEAVGTLKRCLANAENPQAARAWLLMEIVPT